MRTSVTYGILLAICVAVWTYVLGYSGLYKHPVGAIAFMLVIPLNIVVVVLCLLKTRREGRRYGGQVAAGLVLGVVAAVLIFINSLVFTQVLFPTYFDDLRALQEELLIRDGVPEEEVRARVDAAQSRQTPMLQATAGAAGTVGTSLITALIAAAFIRSKD